VPPLKQQTLAGREVAVWTGSNWEKVAVHYAAVTAAGLVELLC
jgi:hypothetical protein